MAVLRGSFHEAEGALPFRPWIEVIREYRELPGAPAIDALDHGGAVDVRRLVPELEARLDDDGAATRLPADRLRLFDAVSRFLLAASRSRALFIVLEDIHWADQASILLLQHIARRVGRSTILIVATYRNAALEADHPLAAIPAQLRERRLAEHVQLSGFNVDETREFLAAAAGQEIESISRRYAEAVWTQTDGNPYFIEELLRYLIETGELSQRDGRWRSRVGSVERLAIPDGVKQVLRQRIGRLSPQTQEVLSTAAILGREFSPRLLEVLTGLSEAEVYAAADEAVAASLINEVRQSENFRFVHALVQRTLVETIAAPRRRALHLRAAEAIEQTHGESSAAPYASLAEHFRAAGRTAPVEKVLYYGTEAMQAACRSYAWEDAQREFEATLAAAEQTDAPAIDIARVIAAYLRAVGDDFVGTERVRELTARASSIFAAHGDEVAAATMKRNHAATFQTSSRRDLIDFARARTLLGSV
jgi:predicted ATPase